MLGIIAGTMWEKCLTVLKMAAGFSRFLVSWSSERYSRFHLKSMMFPLKFTVLAMKRSSHGYWPWSCNDLLFSWTGMIFCFFKAFRTSPLYQRWHVFHLHGIDLEYAFFSINNIILMVVAFFHKQVVPFIWRFIEKWTIEVIFSV